MMFWESGQLQPRQLPPGQLELPPRQLPP